MTSLDKLRRLGDARKSLDVWPDYLNLGLGREHINALIELALDRRLFESDEETPEIWAAVHAWRALAQLRAVEAAEPLCGLLPLADSAENGDWILEEFPAVFGLIGPAALPALQQNMAQAELGVFARSTASGGIVEIGKSHAGYRLECIEIIKGQLRRYDENDEELNGFLVGDLVKLRAVEAIETIREAFRHSRVEIAIPGDLEDVEIELGLRIHRDTPKPRYGLPLETGRVPEAARAKKVGRNDPCPCGSGKKYKKCCLSIKNETPRPEQITEADSIYREALELDALSNSVIDLIKTRRFPEAEAACKKLQTQFPDFVDGYERSVLVYKAQGDYSRAAQYARKAIGFMQARVEEYQPESIAEMEAELRRLQDLLAPLQARGDEKATQSRDIEDPGDLHNDGEGANGEEEEYWWQRLAALSPVERYETILRTLEEGLTPQFLEEADPLDTLLNLKHELLAKGYVAETAHLVHQMRASLPGGIYAKEYEYFDGVLVDWALFNGDPQGAKEGLSNFFANPVRGIDSMLPILNKLCYYGLTDQAILLSQETFDRVDNSPDLIGGASWELAHCLYLARLARLYEQHRQGAAVDWQSLAGEMEPYGIEIDQELMERICAGLTGSLDGGNIAGAFGGQRDRELTNLAFGFFRYMRDMRNMDFPCSELIWRHLLDFLSARKLPAKGVQPDAFFRLTRKELEPHLAKMIGGLLSRRQADAVAMLWGIPYVYDFLRDLRVISGTIHDEAGKVVAGLKAEIIRAMGRRLWELDFVHHWPAPPSVSQDEWEAEAEVFRKSSIPAVPLAEWKGKR